MLSSTPSSRPSGRRKYGIGSWMALPAIVLLAIFVLVPLFRTFQLSGYASDLIGNPTRFVGLGNYVSLVEDPAFVHTIIISVVIALLGMFLATFSALVAALLLRRRILGGGLFAVIFSLPFAYSAASASAVFAGLFAPSVGVLNIMLGGLGLSGPAWLDNPIAAVWAIAIATSWYEFGFAFLVLTAAVREVPSEVIEAATIDGARGFRLAVGILIPIMRPSILFLTVTETITGLQSFAQVAVLTKGGPSGETTTFVYRLYQLAFGNSSPDFGRASVIAVVLVLIVTVITAIQFRLFGRERTV